MLGRHSRVIGRRNTSRDSRRDSKEATPAPIWVDRKQPHLFQENERRRSSTLTMTPMTIAKSSKTFASDNELKSEAEQYLEAEPDADEISLLDWWAKHQHRYPRLAKMARDVFTVPATGVGVEREFSKSGKVATATRARLNPETVEETMRYKDYLRRFEKAEMKRNEVRAEESGEEIEEEYQLDEVGQLFGVNIFRTKAPRTSRKE